jgi:hypothetical protein
VGPKQLQLLLVLLLLLLLLLLLRQVLRLLVVEGGVFQLLVFWKHAQFSGKKQTSRSVLQSAKPFEFLVVRWGSLDSSLSGAHARMHTHTSTHTQAHTCNSHMNDSKVPRLSCASPRSLTWEFIACIILHARTQVHVQPHVLTIHILQHKKVQRQAWLRHILKL